MKKMKFYTPEGSIIISHGSFNEITAIETNQAYCFQCKTFLESTDNHHFCECKCGNYIDGGLKHQVYNASPHHLRLFQTTKQVDHFKDKLIDYENCAFISVSEPWYGLIANKKKTIEGRLNKFGIEKLKKGDLIVIKNRNNTSQSVLVQLKERKHYDNIQSYLKECLFQALPVKFINIHRGVEIYRQFIGEKTEQEMGIEALFVEVLDI